MHVSTHDNTSVSKKTHSSVVSFFYYRESQQHISVSEEFFYVSQALRTCFNHPAAHQQTHLTTQSSHSSSYRHHTQHASTAAKHASQHYAAAHSLSSQSTLQWRNIQQKQLHSHCSLLFLASTHLYKVLHHPSSSLSGRRKMPSRCMLCVEPIKWPSKWWTIKYTIVSVCTSWYSYIIM